MTTEERPPLVSTGWLAAHLGGPDLCVVDVRWRSRYEGGRGISFDDHEGYLAGHIPGAVFCAMIGELSDPAHPVPDGGLRQWQAEGRPLSTEVPAVAPAELTVRPRPDWVAEKQDVVAALDDPDTVIIDCLSPEQYRGGDSHLWGPRAGHIPGAANVPALANIDPALATATSAERERLLKDRRSFTFSDGETLAKLYKAAGVAENRRVITYCGRGFAASCGLLALKVLGHERACLYDGSWSEWSADPDLPVETGPGDSDDLPSGPALRPATAKSRNAAP